VEAGMPPASGLSVSRCGNPFGIADGGRFSTFVALYYYNFARFVAQHEPFSDVDVVVEIGSGSGAQAEVLKRLYPHLTIVLLDLAPQLYVAERFLRKAMPDFAVPYRRTHHSGWDGTLVPGGVHALRPQAIETLDPDGRVLFWNAASFGEMEPEVVENYATHVSRFAESLFLMQFFHGKQLGTPGAGGVLRQSTMASYEAAFADYERVAEAEAVRANGVTVLREGTLPYLNTLWRRRAA
jgi:putative sugar O-methyltransferase